jgi:GT2 family glycosyltransferase
LNSVPKTTPISGSDIAASANTKHADGLSRLRFALRSAPAQAFVSVTAPEVCLDSATEGLLRAALEQDTTLGCVSPMAAQVVRDVWELPENADVQAEAWTWAPRVTWPAAADLRCSVWRREAAEAFLADGACTSAVLPSVALELPGAAMPVPGLAGLRPERLATSFAPATSAGRDERPVLLHVLHDWGGGAERFVRDQMGADDGCHHLALVSVSKGLGRFGHALALHTRLDAAALRLWRFDSPLGDMAEAHANAKAALQEIIDDFGVSAIRVSSLIGHSLDVLRTGLPTQFVVHDLFPFWPALDDLSDPPEASAARLREYAQRATWLFDEREPARWRARADATSQALLDAQTTLVAPSHSALSRFRSVAPPLLSASAVIPHGIAPMKTVALDARNAGPLRVLVPGRLRGGKGERLLDVLLPIAPEGIDWCFAGGSDCAERYAEQVQGKAIADYRNDELASIVAGFNPDIALLPSLLPETFGYVLSEMQGLGVPVLAAAVGAYAERLGAAALSPNAQAFAAALEALVANPDAARHYAGPHPPSLEANQSAWRALTPTVSGKVRFDAGTEGQQTNSAVNSATLAAELEWLARERNAAYDAYTKDTAELTRQRDEIHSAYQRDTEDLARQRDVAVAQVADLEVQRQALDAHNHALDAHGRALQKTAIALREETAALREEVAKSQEEAAHAHAERDAAYGYYERDTLDLARQRDTALSQRDAAQEQLIRAKRVLDHPLIRIPLRTRRYLNDRTLALRYRIERSLALARRGLSSLQQRGVGPTLNALARRFSKAQPAEASEVASSRALAFEQPKKVRASIIIPVYGKLDYTMACLHSLVDTELPSDVEVIVVDDASPDQSAEALAKIPGLRLHKNAKNLGFVGSCNAGAALAQGEYLVFLNNDTTVKAGWLNALLGTFNSHPDTGLAGAQLVYPDGRLQESGGIVFSDGSGWNYGRFEDPHHPSFTFVREVDYCSGAAIAIKHSFFEALGGFDERYAPAYYEDTDLAMKTREAGFKVRVQPASVVIHHEGITSGTDLKSGVKAYQVRNQQRFLERWRDVLSRRHPTPTQEPHYAAQHRARARVLVIDATTPMPDRDSGSVRLFELLRLLVGEGCAVTFFPENGLDDGRYTRALRDLGVEAWTQPWLGSMPDWLAKHGARFQLIIVSRHYILSPLLPLLRRYAPQARIVFDTVDLHHLREQREAERDGDPVRLKAAARTRHEELTLIQNVDRTWVVSPVEKQLLAADAPDAQVDVVSNIHRVRGAGPARTARKDLVFVGGFRHPPNVDAARWLAEDILPRVRAVRPEIGLSLVGSDAPPEVLALGAQPGITVHGFVPDLEPLLDQHRISVAPLRYGAGVKGKVNQALALGLPVVATRCAVEGMGMEDGRDALVADDAEGLAAAILRLYDDESLWNQLVLGGLANTEREFSPERARATLRAVLNDLR